MISGGCWEEFVLGAHVIKYYIVVYYIIKCTIIDNIIYYNSVINSVSTRTYKQHKESLKNDRR